MFRVGWTLRNCPQALEPSSGEAYAVGKMDAWTLWSAFAASGNYRVELFDKFGTKLDPKLGVEVMGGGGSPFVPEES